MLTIIAAVSQNNVIGKDNKLLWHLPDDFKRFKKLTTNHHIIMGRKTFESLPGLLPNRKHVVITRQININFSKDIVVARSLQEALKLTSKDNQPFIIGGGEIYKLGIDYAKKIELTRVIKEFEGDTFFPILNENEWLLKDMQLHPIDKFHKYSFIYETYIKHKDKLYK